MTSKVRNNSWLTVKRLRAHGFLLAVALWGLYAWTIATPGLLDRNGNLKGTDFLHFYTLGSLALEKRGAELYDMASQSVLAARRVPPAAGIHYLPLYPPQVSVLFAPLARLPYGWALAGWWIVSGLIYTASCYAVWRTCLHLRMHGATVALLAVAFPGFFNLIAWGQTSALALACITLTFLFLRNKQEFVAGLALGCLIFKPQLGLAAAIVFLGIGAGRVVAGAVLSAIAEVLIGVLYYGFAPLQEWLRTMVHVRLSLALLEPRLYQTHSLRTFWSMLLPWDSVSVTLYVASAIVLLIITIAIWKREATLAVKFSALLVATVLIAPHLTVYDLVILVPAFLLLADWLLAHPFKRAQRGVGPLLYAVYALPLLASLTRWTRVQLSVIAMAALLVCLWQMAQSQRNECEAGVIAVV